MEVLALPSKADYPELVREARKRLALTQEKFAAKLGVTLPTINRWENGRTKPSPLAVKQIENCVRQLGPCGDDLVSRYFEV